MNVSTTIASGQASPLSDMLQQARSQQMSLTALFQGAESFAGAGLLAQAADLYKTWIAFNDTNPLLHMAWFNYAVCLRNMGDLAGSIQALRACLKQEPAFGPAHINLGRALEDCGLIGQAVRQWRTFSEATGEITPDRLSHRLMALQHTGRVLETAGQLADAEVALWQAIELQPLKLEAGQHWTSLRQHQCKWPVLTPSSHVSARQLLDMMSPLTLGCYADDPLFQLAKAYRYGKNLVGRPDTRGFPRKTGSA